MFFLARRHRVPAIAYAQKHLGMLTEEEARAERAAREAERAEWEAAQAEAAAAAAAAAEAEAAAGGQDSSNKDPENPDLDFSGGSTGTPGEDCILPSGDIDFGCLFPDLCSTPDC